MKVVQFILYVSDQDASARFYEKVLAQRPRLNVPGMTEFQLNGGSVLGLMPAAGIKRLLGDKLPNPNDAKGIPRAEIYLLVEHPEVFHRRALGNGAIELSSLSARDWGHEAAYSLDPDGHVLVFARECANAS
ncbi:MAG: VOC family protein [Caldilinea sp.]